MSAIPQPVLTALREKLRHAGQVFSDARYPIQLKNPPSSEANYGEPGSLYFGEARGFYPRKGNGEEYISNGYFQPWNSFFHVSSNSDGGVHRGHQGLDIYAPYHPFPHEIQVCAVADGTINNRTYWGDFSENKKGIRGLQELGNRVTLSVSVAVKQKSHQVLFFYGHLNRFADDDRGTNEERRSRSVKAGEVIGYVGKSGNADTLREASTRKSPFHVSSAHLHLAAALVVPIKNKNGKPGTKLVYFDPLEVLPKALGYHPSKGDLGYATSNEEKSGRPNATQWQAKKLAALKDAQDEPNVPKVRIRNVEKTGIQRNTFGTKGFRRVILPKPFHRIDVDRTSTLSATLSAYALMKARKDAKPDLFNRAIARWKEHAAEETDTNYWAETAPALAARAVDRFGYLASNDAGHALAAAMHLHEALYVLMGGPAFEELGSDHADHKISCGFGLRGSLLGVALGETVGALHYAKFPTGEDASGTPVPLFSVTFGAGGIRHATLSGKMPLADTALDYYRAVWNSFIATYGVTKTMRTVQTRLSANDAAARARVLTKTENARDQIKMASRKLAALGDTAAKTLIAEVLDANIAHFQAAVHLSKKPDTTGPRATPDIFALCDAPPTAGS
ncbi:M23 family metallopeptidase [Mesorhizobium sp. WSM2239]|uniref:M23 family metallopeptidase n=2 Tax=unclassified Mesorhizobium TaxID=325217 RepID=A0AAU8DI22_9HYPH